MSDNSNGALAGVKIVDLLIDLGSHRMGERTLIFRKLAAAERFDIHDTLNRARAFISGEFLIPIDGQTLF